MKLIRIEDSFEICGVERELIIRFIEEDWVHPADQESLGLDEEDLARIRLIKELREDFGVNDEGISIILPLIDQLNRIQLEIRKYDSENNLS